ncbi:MAG: exodeoxyribonuclease V subunit alpha [Burkholderiaceae bacterium]
MSTRQDLADNQLSVSLSDAEHAPTDSTDSIASPGAGLVAGSLLRMHRRADGPVTVEASLVEAVNRLWQSIEAGDVCLPLPSEGDHADGRNPALVSDLLQSPVVMRAATDGANDDIRPLVLEGTRLSTYRFWRAEQDLAAQLVSLAAQAPELPYGPEHAPDASLGTAQRQALETAGRCRLLVLTGGPGTGKTYTLAAIVKAAVSACRNQSSGQRAGSPPFTVAVVAPTGKATARIASAIGDALTDQPGVLLEAMTLHRLLGLSARAATHAASIELPFDLVVVDESSMVDTLLAARLLSSLRPTTQLILAGDRDQLSSVQAGAFFGTLCSTLNEAIAACRVTLDQNYRQQEAPEILAWAEGVRSGRLAADGTGDAPTLAHGKQLLFDAGGVNRLTEFAAQRLTPLIERAGSLKAGDEVPLLRRYMQCQILAALRSGPEGINALNEAIGLIARRVAQATAGPVPPGALWFAGRLVVVRKNATHRDLFNGDIGLCVSLPDGPARSLRVVFERPDGSARHLLPSQMPVHEDAWALTVHQAQGSDFEEVHYLPAPADHPLASREGLYTAITRARKRMTVFGELEDVAGAAARPGRRESGLMDALAAQADHQGGGEMT